jgi:hypothetical protein
MNPAVQVRAQQQTYPYKIENGSGLGFPLLLAVGKILGNYAKFEDAPEPIHASGAGAR